MGLLALGVALPRTTGAGRPPSVGSVLQPEAEWRRIPLIRAEVLDKGGSLL